MKEKKNNDLVRDITMRGAVVRDDEEETAVLLELFEEYKDAYRGEWVRGR